MIEQDRTERTDDYVSLAPALQHLWSYRRVIGAALLGVTVCFVGALIVIYARTPRERIATLGFQLTFSGAEHGTFPNGAKFSPAEIVATSVLSEVFKKNSLEEYLPYTEFRNALFVVEADPDLQMLAFEYEAKLSDPRLSTVDRARLEEEYRTKRESLRSARFSLNVRGGGPLSRIPAPVISKIMHDTLSTWAWQAAERRGAVRYNIPVMSHNVLKNDLLTAEDPVVAIDMLRGIGRRMLATISDIAAIPGAATVRVGENQMSLEDIRINVDDLLRFRMEPLVGVVNGSGLLRADPYFAARLDAVHLDRAEAQRRLKTLQDTLQLYQQRGVTTGTQTPADASRPAAVTPQLSESFIDRLLELSSESSDIGYRQGLTDRIIREGMLLAELDRQADYYESMRRMSRAGREASGVTPAQLNVRIDRIMKDIGNAMGQIQAIYKEISDQNLNPDTVLYAIRSPFVEQRSSTLNMRMVLFYFAAAFFAAVALVVGACLLHAYYRERIRPASRRLDPVEPPAARTSHLSGV